MHVSRFSNGGFVIHKLILQNSKGRFSAWFDKDGNLLDAEQLVGFSWSRSVAKGGPNWDRIAAIGRRVATYPV